MSIIFKKIKTLEEIEQVCKLYLAEEEIIYNHSELDSYIKKAYKIYNDMLLDGSFTFGAFDNDKLVAVINANKNCDYYPMYENNPYYHLETFIVRKQYQNMGIGTNLISNIIKILKESGCTYIHMQSDNEYVYRIAKKCGLVESIKDMRMDFVHMEKRK